MWNAHVRAPARFAIDSTIQMSGPPGTRRIRWITMPKVVLGGVLGNLYDRLGVPFELTPLFSLPALVAGAYFLYVGPVWLGVLLCAFHTVNDLADGVATGLWLDAHEGAPRPHGRLGLRRFFDTYVSDVVARFVLVMALVLRLHDHHQVHPWLLMVLVLVELVVLMLSSEVEGADRRRAFHHEFVLAPGEGRRQFGWSYPLQVIFGQLASWQCYSLLPLLGYVWGLDQHGMFYFVLLLVARLGALVSHVRGTVVRLHAATAPSAARATSPPAAP
jgi:hypothetical protein